MIRQAWIAQLILAAAVLCSCGSTPRLTHTATATSGVVRASSEGLAAGTAAHLDAAVAFVRKHLPGASLPPQLEVEVVTEPWRTRHHAVTAGQAWAGNRILLLDQPHLEAALVHECAHLAMASSWSVLPRALQEGVAQHLELLWDPSQADTRRAFTALMLLDHLGGAQLAVTLERPPLAEVVITLPSALDAGPTWPLREALSFATDAEWASLSLDQRDVAREIGVVVVQRIVGRHGLIALHDRCSTSWERGEPVADEEWLLSTAGISDTPEGWRTVAMDLLDEGTLAYLARTLLADREDILAEIVGASQLTAPASNARTALDQVPMSLSVTGTQVDFPLNSIAAFRDAFANAWARLD